MGKKKEEKAFESDVKQVLDLVINSLYSNREIFLRELISNAADATDKLRFLALSKEDLYEGQSDEGIEIDGSEEQGTITIRDYGIGMDREEVIENLGTIARSGTKEFFRGLTGDQQKDSDLIGQFGVGFYSAFIVANKVIVTSRKAGLDPDEGIRWESDGQGEYSLETVRKKKRGTEIILYLKEDAKEFASLYRLKSICLQYSDHVSIPISMPKPEGATGYEVVNQGTAMWRKSKSELKAKDYKEFYKSLSSESESPMKWVHTKAEGKLEYTSLFYIPSRPPFDLWDRNGKSGVKLFVKRVLIMEDSETLLPRFLRFIKGVIDTDDMPLNVSREILQENKKLETIRAASVKKILGMIESLAKTKEYPKFWETFGNVLKEGVVEDFDNKDKISSLLRFSSTNDSESLTSLKDYVSRMKDGQEDIYYVTADNLETALNSPHLESFRDKNIEVLLMHEPIDEWVVGHLPEFESKKIKSVLNADLKEEAKLDQSGEQVSPLNEEEKKEILSRLKASLGDSVADVAESHRLKDSLVCLVSTEEQMSPNLERVLKAAGQEVPVSKRILEVNLSHPLVTVISSVQDDEELKDWSTLLYEQSILSEGGKVGDPAGFVRKMNAMLMKVNGADT